MPRSSTARTGAAIDIGSNSVHLLAARLNAAPSARRRLRTLLDQSELLGLGDVVDAHGEIPRHGRTRVLEVVLRFRALAVAAGVRRVTLIGTEPLRRARNADRLVKELRDAARLELHVLSLEQEAQLTFVGVTGGVPPVEPLIVVDIGGGSTEIGYYVPDEGLRVSAVPVGSARLTNALVSHDPPTEGELAALHEAAGAIRGVLPPVGATGGRPARAVFVGGTATNVARLGRLTREGLAEDRSTLARLASSDISTHFGVRPRRASQLAAGAAIVGALLDHFGLDEALVSEASLRDGAIVAAWRFGDRWPERLEELLRTGSSERR